MIRNTPKTRSVWKPIAGGIILLEVVAFGAAYICWRSINHSRDRRYQVYQTFPSLLNGYYKFGEFMDKNSKIRQLDLETWRAEGRQL